MSLLTSIFDCNIIYDAYGVPHRTSFAFYPCFYNECGFTFRSNFDTSRGEFAVSYEIWGASFLGIDTSALSYLCIRATHSLLLYIVDV